MRKRFTIKFFKYKSYFFTISFTICALLNLKAQMVYLPDTNFRNALISQGFGVCIAGDSIDGSCPLVSNTNRLNVSNSNIHNLQGLQVFTNLHKLDCGYNYYLTSIPVLAPLLDSLICPDVSITILPILPNSLSYLDCSYNNLTNLPAMNSSLIYLNCQHNQLLNLPALPSSLRNLDCFQNQIANLPALPNSLSTLNCGYNLLTSLPALPNNLDQLYCDINQITSLPILPQSLTILECSGNLLTSLPWLPALLFDLRCHDNQLTNLNLPQALGYLECSNNPLNILPSLPVNLYSLKCNYDNLTYLPSLPTTLYSLNCGANALSGLPPIPNTVTQLYCGNNQITNLPELPDSLWLFDCSSNPNLICLPQLKRIATMYFSNTSVTCLPNYGSVSTSTPPLSSLPLCGLNVSNTCPVFWNISGKCYLDSNLNCFFDSIEFRERNLHLMLYQNGNLMQQAFTGGQGYYSFEIANNFGTYQTVLDTSIIPLDVYCPSSNTFNDTINAIDTLRANRDFSLVCKNGFDVGAKSIVGRFRPGRYSSCKIEAGDIANFYGTHCANGVSGSVTITLTGSVIYFSPDSGALTPSSVVGNTITYNVADFGTIDAYTAFNLIVQADTFAVIGSNICISVSVTSIAGDNNPGNNSLNSCFTVVGSFDPNEKEVSPTGDIDLAGDRWLTYTIHFQNTGTAPADYIYILDTLDQKFDLSTFQLLAYSHQPFVQILNGGIAKFNFPDINLPDSFHNEPASHGYIQYKIRLKNNATVGSQIRNAAYIYFDFNSPVATNTTLNTVTSSVGVSSLSTTDLRFSIFPNPGHDEFTVYCPQFTPGKKLPLKMYDVFGKEVLTCELRSSSFQLHASEFPAGIYFLSLDTGNGTVVRKLVKQ